MADGGVSDEGEFIANVYDNYDAEVGSTVTSMYADGGIISEYENILISNGFKKENYRNTYGSNVYYTKGDITANINVDEVSLFNGDDRTHYFGYFKQQPFANMQDFVETLEYLEDFDKYAKGGMVSRYEIEQEKDGTWMILDKQRGMYIDRWFETKKQAENYLFYKIKEDNYGLPLTDFDRRIIDYAKGLPNNDNQDEKFYMSKGGFFGDSRYNEGRSWHQDRARHNKKENYEKPLKYRKRRRI